MLQTVLLLCTTSQSTGAAKMQRLRWKRTIGLEGKTTWVENKKKGRPQANQLIRPRAEFSGVAHILLSRKFVGCAPRANGSCATTRLEFWKTHQMFHKYRRRVSPHSLTSHLIARLICRYGGRAMELEPVVLDYNAHTSYCCWLLPCHDMMCAIVVVGGPVHIFGWGHVPWGILSKKPSKQIGLFV